MYYHIGRYDPSNTSIENYRNKDNLEQIVYTEEMIKDKRTNNNI